MFYNFFANGLWFGWVFWIAVIVLIIWAVSNSSSKRNQHMSNLPHQQTPLEILKIRYAKGEITKEQFDQMRKDIET